MVWNWSSHLHTTNDFFIVTEILGNVYHLRLKEPTTFYTMDLYLPRGITRE
jgi:hypothetical protein